MTTTIFFLAKFLHRKEMSMPHGTTINSLRHPRFEVVEMDPDILDALNANSDEEDFEELDVCCF